MENCLLYKMKINIVLNYYIDYNHIYTKNII